MAYRSGDEALYFSEQRGVIRAVRLAELDPTPVLDISAIVSSEGERGLLGLAFAPNAPLFYINYTDKAGDTHIVEYAIGADGRANVGSRRELLFVDQPFPNHNGGHLAFGPDGHLYIGLGDGGSSGDPQKNGQNLSVLLAKILRINPAASKDLPYTVPFDNPFAKQQGARGEIWAYGLRNPWRFSFDRAEQGIWIADVGQNKFEEINHVAKDGRGGQNYGWSLREGKDRFSGDKPTDAVDPVYQYDHSNNACSVTGGYVYRGSSIPAMTGRYLYGDYCSGAIFSLTKRGSGWESDKLNITLPELSSFGQDSSGELYVLGLDGTVARIDAA
jgi:glucose/arabinose dehydrogenase